MTRETTLCRAYRRRFTLVVLVGWAGCILFALFTLALSSRTSGGGGFESWLVPVWGLVCDLGFLLPVAGWYSARRIATRDLCLKRGVVVTGTIPVQAIRLALVALLVTLAMVAPFATPLWRFLNPQGHGFWDWEDFLYLLTLPFLGLASIALFIRLAQTCAREARRIAVVRFEGESGGDDSAYRCLIEQREAIFTTEGAACTARLHELHNGELTLLDATNAERDDDLSQETWLLLPHQDKAEGRLARLLVPCMGPPRESRDARH